MSGESVRYPCAVASLAVIGAGYVGLTTACCLAHLGHDVVATDRDPARLARLREGRSPIVEDGLEPLLTQGLDSGRLRFEADNRVAAAGAEFVFLCVPTPSGPDGRADMSYIRSAAAEIGPVLAPDAVVVNKSTVPVGSTKVVEQALGRADVAVVSNPEFLREGTAVWDFLHPDRIVIGAEEESVAIRVSGLFLKLSAPLVVCEPASAETIKYASNAFLATKISFVNAMAALCEAVGADIRQVALGMGYDRRIGAEFLRPGPGWGGSCFPKDTAALLRIAEDNGYDFSLLEGVVAVNEEQRLRTNFSEWVNPSDRNVRVLDPFTLPTHTRDRDLRSFARLILVSAKATFGVLSKKFAMILDVVHRWPRFNSGTPTGLRKSHN
jgi:UDPglucose 6-dehydrogenase